MAAPITLCQSEASAFQRLHEGCFRIGSSPTLLQHGFEVARIVSRALGLMPFSQCEIPWVGFPAVHQAARHLPVIFQIQIAREIAQLHFEEREVFGGHRVRIDAAPDSVGVAAAFLFMKNDSARLPCKPVSFLDAGNSVLKRRDLYALMGRREVQGKLFPAAALRSFEDHGGSPGLHAQGAQGCLRGIGDALRCLPQS